MNAALHTVSIAEILGIGDEVRTQNPRVQWTRGKSPRAYIRPYVDRLIENRVERVQERIYLEAKTKRDAEIEKNRIMPTINNSKYVVQAQVKFGDFLDLYLKNYVRRPENLGAGTRDRYESQIKNHIRPAFGHLAMAHVTTMAMDAWMGQKAAEGMASSTRESLRGLMSGIFSQAAAWDWWKERNPTERVSVGKARPVYERVKLTTKQTRDLLDSLPADVRIICEVALYTTLRISEVLGLMWKHIDFQSGLILVRQRWYRGDLDEVKSLKSNRDVPMGLLAADISRMPAGKSEEFVFSVATHVGDWKRPGACRDDRDILQHFLRPAAKSLGIYRKGFGFHAFRREAVTGLSLVAGASQAQKMAGHSKASMTQHYTLNDQKIQKRAVETMQRKIRGDRALMKGA